jgi:hypothetical protein
LSGVNSKGVFSGTALADKAAWLFPENSLANGSSSVAWKIASRLANGSYLTDSMVGKGKSEIRSSTTAVAAADASSAPAQTASAANNTRGSSVSRANRSLLNSVCVGVFNGSQQCSETCLRLVRRVTVSAWKCETPRRREQQPKAVNYAGV